MGKGLKFCCFLFTILALASCEPDDPIEEFGSDTGIKGKVMVQNEFQQPLYGERDGIEVFLETGYQDFAVTADNTGEWLLSGAPVGNYTITYSKEGYSKVIQTGIHISNTVPNYPVDNGFQKLPTATITRLPLTEFEDFEMDLNVDTQMDDTIYSLAITATMLPAPPPTGQAKGYRIFIGEDETVSPENYIYQEYFNTTTAAIEVTYDDDWFADRDIQSGDALFAAIYGDVSFNQEIQLSDSTTVFPNISQMQGGLASVVLP